MALSAKYTNDKTRFETLQNTTNTFKIKETELRSKQLYLPRLNYRLDWGQD